MEKPKLIIPYKSYIQIMSYADLADGEVSGFADVDWDEESQALKMGEVYLLKQEATAADVEMDENTVADFNFEMIKKGKTQLPRIWWHSHSDMGVFFSGTDQNTISELTNDSFILALVVNKKHEMRTILKICQPLPPFISPIIEDINIEVLYDFPKIPSTYKKEVEEKVKAKKFNFFFGEKKHDIYVSKKDKSKVFYFSKDKEEIKKIIKNKKLSIQWGIHEHEWVWVNDSKTIKYLDKYGVIEFPWDKEWNYYEKN